MRELDFGKLKSARRVDDLQRETRFTEIYCETGGLHPFEREMACLEEQTRMILTPVQRGDWFAGRLHRMFVGIDPERGDVVEPAYFCQFDLLKEQLNDAGVDDGTKTRIRYLLDFWKGEATYFACRDAFPPEVREGLPSDDYYASQEISYPMYGLGGPVLDYGKLLHLGLPGLEKEVRERREKGAPLDRDQEVFLDCLAGVIDLVREMAGRYEMEARDAAGKEADDGIRRRYHTMAESLKTIRSSAPGTFHEAIQLMWLYNLVSLTKNYGRMDNYLGLFLVNDLERGIIDRKEALEMLTGLWRQIVDRGDNYNNRIVIGGKGRKEERYADEFALLALDAQERVNDALPQLSLRYYEGMDPRLWEASFRVLATGSTFPIIYNDDVNIPAVEKAFRVTAPEAEHYFPYGCGEYILEHGSIGSPDAALNVLKALDVTLHDGVDGYSGKKMGLALGSFESFHSFEALKAAFARQLEHQVSLLARAQESIYRTTSEHAAFPALSLLYDDCIQRAKPLLGGGVKYLGGTIETFGNNSAADALYAIKKTVYDRKIFTPARLLEILHADFKGFEKERKILKDLPKFGNDIDEVDDMVVWVDEVLGRSAAAQHEYTGLDHFLVVNINNGDSVLHGKRTAASADGRRAGEPLSNGNQPSAGNDTHGATALLNSMAKVPAECHAGMTQAIKFSRRSLNELGQQSRALIQGYFLRGGTQVMVTSVDTEELENAVREPELYRHVFVRVGGYSERFVDLPKDIQREVIKRTLY